MIKRILLGGGGLLLLGACFLGRDVVSYVRTSVAYVTDGVRQSVPLEFQLQRARQMLKDLLPDVQRNMHLIAKEEVELARLAEQITSAEAKLAQEKKELEKLRTEVAAGKASYVFGARKYTLEQVRTDLAQRFARYKTNDATLANLQQLQAARQRGLDAARQKLDGMLAARRQLQVEVENLEARNQMVAAAETGSKYHFDDSRLGRLKELLADLRTRLEVNERMIGAEAAYHDEIPLAESVPADLTEQIGAYFRQPGPAKGDSGS